MDRVLPAVLLVATLLVFVADGARLHHKTLAPGSNDFEMFWEGARRTVEGGDVYAVENWGYPYLPTFYVVMAPLGLLPLGAAAIAWHSLKFVVLVACFAALWRLLPRCGFPASPLAAGIAVLGIARALDSDLQLGQCNLVVLGLVVLSLHAYLTYRDEVAGLAAVLAALYKVTPGLLLIYFAWKARGRVLLGAATGLLFFGVVAPALVFGPGETVRLYGEFHDRVLRPRLEGEPSREGGGYQPGQSLSPVIHRLLTPSRAVSGRLAEKEPISIHVADLDPGAVRWIAGGASLALVALALGLAGRSSGTRRTRVEVLEFGLVVAVMLLASPYARKAHFVALLVPLWACAAWAVATGSRPLLVLTAAAALLPGLTSPTVLGRDLSERVTAYGPFTVSALVLAGISAAAILRERRSLPERRDSSGTPAISIVLPAFNEEGNIGRTVEGALAVLPSASPVHEVIVVDDGSRDGTAAVVEAIAARRPGEVRLVRHDRNRGYGAAVRSGIEAARHPVVLLSDGDGQFDLRELPEFLRPIAEGRADAVLGWRRRRQDPFRRLVFAYCWGALVRTLFGIPARDVDCAFKALPRELLCRLDLKSDGALISTEMLAKLDRAGCRMVERPVTHLPREHGVQTGANPRVILRAFAELVRFRAELSRFQPAPTDA